MPYMLGRFLATSKQLFNVFDEKFKKNEEANKLLNENLPNGSSSVE